MEQDCHRLDMRGLRCPLPVLKAHKALRALGSGTVVVVRTDDEAAPKDFQDYCELAQHEWLSAHYDDDDKAWHVMLRVKGKEKE